MKKVEGKEEQLSQETTPLVEKAEPPKVEKTFTQAEVEVLLADKDKSYKGLQKVIDTKDKRIQELESQPTTGESTKELRALRKDVAMLWDAVTSKEEGIEETKPKSSKLAQLEAELKVEQEREWNRQVAEFANIAKESGKDAYKDPEFEDCRDLFDAGKPEKALQKARKIANQLKETTKVPEEKTKDPEVKETPEAMEERIKRKILDELKLTKSDLGGPSGGDRVYSRGEIVELAKLPIDEYAKVKPEIDRARKEGRIKD